MLIIDGDYPMATGALVWDRDLSWELSRIRTAEPGIVKNGGWPDAYTMASLPEMRKGADSRRPGQGMLVRQEAGPSTGEFRTQNLAYAGSMGQLAYYRLLASQGEAAILDTREAFASHMTPGRMPPTTPSCRSAS